VGKELTSYSTGQDSCRLTGQVNCRRTSDVQTAQPKAPGRPGISFESYEKAYIELSGPDGTPPSQRQLRKYLGTGSNTTLSNYRRRINEERLKTESPKEPNWPDAEILATAKKLASQLEIQEAQIADDRVDEIQKDADNRIRVAETTMKKRLQDIALLEHRAITAENELAHLRGNTKKSAEKATKTINELTRNIHALEANNAVLEQARLDTTRQIADLMRRAQAQQHALDEANATEKNNTKASNEALSALQEQLSESQQTHAALRQRYESLSTSFDEQLTVINSKDTQLLEMQKRVDQTTRVREETLRQLNELSEQHTKLTEKVGRMSSELKAEKRAHKTTSDRAIKDISDKNAALDLIQNSLDTIKKATVKNHVEPTPEKLIHPWDVSMYPVDI